MEYINISGLRLDGRRPHEVRRVRSQMGLFPRADGSALLEMGHTKVMAVVHGPREAPFKSATEHDAAVLECDFEIAAFATPERRKRRGGASDRRALEIETALRQSFESVIELHSYPRSLISLHVLVLQADGGLLPAALNAGMLALLDAGVACRDYVAACSVLHVQRTLVLDPCHAEMTSGGPELTVALHARSGKATLTTMDARLPLDLFAGMLGAASKGAQQVSARATRRHAGYVPVTRAWPPQLGPLTASPLELRCPLTPPSPRLRRSTSS